MNILGAIVTKIIDDKPRFKYDKYWISVEYKCYGIKNSMDLFFNSKEEASKVTVGYKFLI